MNIVASVALGLSGGAFAAFWGGTFDPPQLHGAHVFETNGCNTIGQNINGQGGCSADLFNLTAFLDNPSHPLNIGSVLTLPDVADVNDVWMTQVGNQLQLIGVDTNVLGGATGFTAPGGAPYTGPWWLQYQYFPNGVPCTITGTCTGPGALTNIQPNILSPGQVVFLFPCPNTRINQCTFSDAATVVTFTGPFATPPSIPEPGTIALLLAGIGGAVATRRKRAKAA